MITVLFRTNPVTTPTATVVANGEDLCDLLTVFEDSMSVIDYTIQDTEYLSGVESVRWYGFVPDAFRKFKTIGEF